MKTTNQSNHKKSGVEEFTPRPMRSVLKAALTLLLFVSAPTVWAQIANSPFNVNVTGIGNIGTVTFDTYKDNSGGGAYSALIQGGFDPNANYLLPGDGYRWLQTVNTTAPIYTWQTAGTTYMDRTRVAAAPQKLVADQSPFYVNLRGPGYGHTLGFQDAPSRDATDPNVTAAFSGTWILYLVCADLNVPNGKDPNISNANQGINGTRDICVLSSFTWGFTVKNGVVSVTAPITQQTGAALNASFASLNTAFGTTDPDQNTFGKSWTLSQTVTCLVPEPSSLALSAILGLPLMIFGRMKTRALK
jgi:hypothetical protein